MISGYAAEISQIMHGLGDGSKANPESAHLIEEIVGQQMNSLLRQAYEVSLARSSNSIGLQEILFLMRKDKVKLVRLLKHLSFKDSLASTMSSVSGTIPPTGSSPYSSQSSSSSGSMSSGPGGGRGFVDLGSLAAASSSSHANQMPITMTISGNSGLSSVSSCSPSSSSCSSVGSNLVSSTSCVPASLLHHVVVPDHTSHQQHQAPFGNQQHQHQDDPSFLPPSSSGSSEQTTGTAAASASGGSVATTVSQQLANAGNAAVMQHLHQHTHHHHEDQRQHLHPLLLQHQHQQQQPPPTKRLKICMDFLRSTLDQSGQLIRAFSDEFFDEIKHKRALRREKMTRNMTDQDYMRFHQSRQVSFVSKSKPNKFREWLSLKARTDDDWLPPHIVINDFAIEVLQYLAYETVAEIVDLCLLVKQDSQKEASDPVHNLVRNIRQPGVLRRPSSYDATMDESSLKRRRQHDVPDEASDCIQPIHVREVSRRFLTPSGIFTMGQRSQLVHKPFLMRLIAL